MKKNIEKEVLKLNGNDIRAISFFNSKRNVKFGNKKDKWSETDWGCALAGEVGELCNFLKKRRKGKKISTLKCAKEMADIYLYLDLIATEMGVDLSKAIVNKFNEVSRRYNANMFMELKK